MILYDKDIREPLFEFLEEYYGKVRILEEITMGESRADIIMVTENALIGLEIKSDADSYTRLAGQVKDYDRYFDRNYVVVGSSHAQHIREHVPSYWGVITVELVDGVFDFYILQHPGLNPALTWEKKLSLLWKPELAALQECFTMPKYKDKKREFIAEKFAERIRKGQLDASALSEKLCEILFERDYTTISETLMEYRRGEIQKKLDVERDPEKRLELMMVQQEKKIQLKNKRKRRRRRFL